MQTNKAGTSFKVYKHQNKFNKKVYIGITCQTVKQRWGKEGKRYKCNPYFYKAIQKYGWEEGFTHEILFEGLNEQQACEKEIELIAKYKSNDPEFGYNILKGGQKSKLGTHLSEETKEKIRKAHIGKKPTEETRKRLSESHKGLLKGSKHPFYGKRGKQVPMYGKHLSQEARLKMSQAKQGIFDGEKNPMYGKKHTPQSILKNSQNQPNKKQIICLDTLKIYNSMSEASRDLHINRKGITPVCNGKHSQTNGYHFMFLNDYIRKEQ